MLDIVNHLVRPYLKYELGFKVPQMDRYGTDLVRPRERSVGIPGIDETRSAEIA